MSSSTLSVLYKSGAVTEIPHVNRPDAERTMVEIINAMAACLPFIVVEDSDTSALIVLGEVAGVTLGAPPIAVQIERPKPRPVPQPQPRPQAGALIAN
ncbi:MULTISPECIES: hypothetical protein [unclassified Bradyrhizobium]|uniref:hypothetical protein n=1 Tax=unclassified Bradyrhizobium TaxID=2631580 RepID=UPI0028E69FFC|nr:MULTISPECIES: hypothetical protein [unclassified Bradyrhizobium]